MMYTLFYLAVLPSLDNVIILSYLPPHVLNFIALPDVAYTLTSTSTLVPQLLINISVNPVLFTDNSLGLLFLYTLVRFHHLHDLYSEG